MRSKKSDNERNTSKISAFQTPKTNVAARKTKPKPEHKGNPGFLAKSVGRENGAKPALSQLERPAPVSEAELQACIAKRAYELYEQRGCQHGYDMEDWLQAAREVLAQKCAG